MHEQSLVRAILNQVEQVRQQHDATQVTRVRVEVGPMSCVDPTLLAAAFARTDRNSTVADAELVVDEVPLMARCIECESEFQVEAFEFRCPQCRGRVRVIRGDEVQLVSVTVC